MSEYGKGSASPFASRKDYAILYLRPDGWWVAGDGFADHAEATDAAKDHDWRGSRWKIAESRALPKYLCPEAMECYLEELEDEVAG